MPKSPLRWLALCSANLAFASSVMLVPAGSAAAETMREAWTLTGLENPESAVYDPASNVIYVSNTNSDVMVKDGNGFISKVSPDGEVIELEWVKGLDSPTGIVLANGLLYVADIDRLVAIDPAKGAITATYTAPEAKFLNDTTVDAKGRVYAGDMITNTIWVLEDGRFSPWVHDERLENPNGLLAEQNRIVVGAWGVMTDGPKTKVPGHLVTVDLASKAVTDLGDPTPVGNIDGVVADGHGGYFLTDWMVGGLFHADAHGKATRLLPLGHGSADLGVVPSLGLLLVPMSADDKLVAYVTE